MESRTGALSAMVDEPTHQLNQSQELLDAGATVLECLAACCPSFGPPGHAELAHFLGKMGCLCMRDFLHGDMPHRTSSCIEGWAATICEGSEYSEEDAVMSELI